MFELPAAVLITLVVCVFLACFFEFINGFHDTANAVATVIYTNSLRPTVAVVYSGILNFSGVMMGGIAVAMGIVNLLPLEQILEEGTMYAISIVLAILISSIIWNFGTWYLGIPASSSHTLIGAIFGVSMAWAMLTTDSSGFSAIRWEKVKDALLALFLSPLLGFSCAIIVMFLFKRFVKNDTIYKEPVPGRTPPLWIRMILWTTCGLVSFFHGQNDGQKGIGLMMIILISLLPAYYSLDNKTNMQSIRASVESIQKIIERTDTVQFGANEWKHYRKIHESAGTFYTLIGNAMSVNEIPAEKRKEIRKQLVQIQKSSLQLSKSPNFSVSPTNRGILKREIASVRNSVEFAPTWVILLISVCLGIGTMVGWRRIVITVGEKIGKQHISYAQGASAELVAASGIGMASFWGLPVSTTHMLSSGIAGSMVAKKGIKNLQKKTVRNIALAWILTLPVSILLSAGLYVLFRWILT